MHTFEFSLEAGEPDLLSKLPLFLPSLSVSRRLYTASREKQGGFGCSGPVPRGGAGVSGGSGQAEAPSAASAELGRLVQEAFGRPRALPVHRPGVLQLPSSAATPPTQVPPPHLSPLLLCEGLPPCPCRQGCRAPTPTSRLRLGALPVTLLAPAACPSSPPAWTGPLPRSLRSLLMMRTRALEGQCRHADVLPASGPRSWSALALFHEPVPTSGHARVPSPRTSGAGSLPPTWRAAAPPDGSQPRRLHPVLAPLGPPSRSCVCRWDRRPWAGWGLGLGLGPRPGIPAPLPLPPPGLRGLHLLWPHPGPGQLSPQSPAACPARSSLLGCVFSLCSQPQL